MHFKKSIALIDNVKDLDTVMTMYNLLEYSKNYSKTAGRSWRYFRDQPNSSVGGANNNTSYSIKDSKSFDYKANITGKLEGDNTEKEVEVVVSLKHLSNFWRALDMPSCQKATSIETAELTKFTLSENTATYWKSKLF